MRNLLILFGILMSTQVKASDFEVDHDLVAACAEEAQALVAAITKEEAVPAKLIRAEQGPYTTQLVYDLSKNILNSYEVILFQDEDGQSCLLGSLSFTGDL